MDNDLLNHDFHKWRRFIVHFEGDICVASTGAPTPRYDLQGRHLQELHDPKVTIQHLFYSVVPVKNGGAIVFSWHSGDKACSGFINSLEKVSKELLPAILVQFMFAHVENTFFSAAWWSSLSDRQRDYIRALFMLSNPYYEKVVYIPDKLVPWRITMLRRT